VDSRIYNYLETGFVMLKISRIQYPRWSAGHGGSLTRSVAEPILQVHSGRLPRSRKLLPIQLRCVS